MASRPLPPGRRGRGSRTASVLHLPEAKILSDAPSAGAGGSSYVQQLRDEREKQPTAAFVEPEHESNATEAEEPTPVRSVKAFVSTLEKAAEPVVSVQKHTPEVAAATAAEIVYPPKVVEAVLPQYTPEQPPVVENPTPVAVRVSEPLPPVYATREVSVPKHSEPAIAPARISVAPVPPPAPAAPPAPVIPAPVTAVATAQPTAMPALEGFHPFHLLLPVYVVPEVPETVDCVFDDAAVDMQKNIMKVIKKIFGKDRAKLEDFKINSRLFGNNFMDPHEYVDSLAKDLGGNRALLLVPCLISIQPDVMKRSSLLTAAQSYRIRNLAKLTASVDKPEPEASVHVESQAQSTTLAVSAVPASAVAVAAVAEVVSAPVPVAVETTASPVVQTPIATPVEPAVETHGATRGIVPVDEVPAAPTPETETMVAEAPPSESMVQSGLIGEAPKPKVAAEDCVVERKAHAPVAGSAFVSQPAAPLVSEAVEIETPVLETAAPAIIEVQSIKAVEAVEPIATAAASVAAPPIPSQVVDNAPAPPEVASTQATTSALTVDTTASNRRPSLSSADAAEPTGTPSPSTPLHEKPVRRQSIINLFGEDIGNDSDSESDEDEEDEEVHSMEVTTPVAASKPASSTPRTSPTPTRTSSFYEAESLFGEVIPVAVKPTTTTTTAPPADAQPKSPPAALKSQHSAMLFGFASVGGDDSDSDSDSEFSD